MISKTYCPIPFNHLYIHPTNMSSVCCAFRKNEEIIARLPNIKEYTNLSDHLQHPFLKDIQRKMLAGEQVKGCSNCYYAEEHGYQSVRESIIDTWLYSEPDIHNPKLESIEVTFGNYCNLACRTCTSELSHSWIEDNKRLTKLKLPDTRTNTRINIEREWQDDDFKDLQYMKITGGEPMLHPDFPKFIERLKHSKLSLDIFTNASWVPKKRIFDMLSKFEYCQIYLSIDGTGSVQEYMRHNSNWKITEKSAIKWLKFERDNPNIRVSWSPTWSLMNANYYIDTCNWWLKTINTILSSIDCDLRRTSTNILFGPEHYQIGLLSNIDELKQNASDYINVLRRERKTYKSTTLKISTPLYGVNEIIDMTKSLIKHYEIEIDSRKKRIASETFFKITDALDNMREQSFEKMLPLTYDAMNNRKEGVK